MGNIYHSHSTDIIQILRPQAMIIFRNNCLNDALMMMEWNEATIKVSYFLSIEYGMRNTMCQQMEWWKYIWCQLL